MEQKIIRYCSLIGLSFIIPILSIILIIAVCGNRETGIAYGIIVSFLLVNLIFAYRFLKSSLIVKLLCSFAIAIISSGAAYTVLLNKIKPEFDFYGFWTALFVYAILSIISWEIAFKFLDKRNER